MGTLDSCSAPDKTSCSAPGNETLHDDWHSYTIDLMEPSFDSFLTSRVLTLEKVL